MRRNSDSEREVYKAARQLIEIYDVEAGWQAGLRADYLYSEGDIEGFETWVRITKAVKELLGIGADDKVMRH